MQGGYIRQERPYVTFAALLVTQKRDERKVTLCLYGGSKPPPYAQSPSIANIQSEKYILHSVGARAKFTPAAPLYAGVQTMRARICSAFSCDMFARVVWLRLRRARNYRLTPLAPCRTHSPRMARATNSCTRKKIFKRMENPLK